MRVLMFGWEYPPYAAGGLATATLSLARGLDRLGAEITLVVPFPAEAGAEPGRIQVVSAADATPNLRTVRVPSELRPYASAGWAPMPAAPWARRSTAPTAYRDSLFEDVDEFAAAAHELAGRYPHDVIHAHDWMTYGAGLIARSVSGKPLVAHIHATEFDRSGDWSNAEIREREGRGLRLADRVIANSYITKRQVVERYGVPEEHVDVVHWGIESRQDDVVVTSPFGPGVPVVVFVGRVVMQKGPDYFVEAAARVAALDKRVCFIIAGTGEMLPSLLDRCIDLGIADRVFFAGGISRDQAESYYKIASVVVMPSVSEPFGLVALESLRAGTPVIVSRTSGVAEAVANVVRVDFWDVNDIADKILAVISDSTIGAELRERAKEELSDMRLGPDEPARLTLESFDRSFSSALEAR